MVITTKRLSISCIATSHWIEISIYPYVKLNSSSSEPVTIKYDADSLESDVELETIIGLFNGEPSWRRQHLQGVNLENDEYSKDFYSYAIPHMELEASPYLKITHFTLSKKDFWTPGIPEVKFMSEDLLAGKKHISIITAIKLESLKYCRIALRNIDPLDIPIFLP